MYLYRDSRSVNLSREQHVWRQDHLYPNRFILVSCIEAFKNIGYLVIDDYCKFSMYSIFNLNRISSEVNFLIGCRIPEEKFCRFLRLTKCRILCTVCTLFRGRCHRCTDLFLSCMGPCRLCTVRCLSCMAPCNRYTYLLFMFLLSTDWYPV